jgi:hypothetical protein
MLGVLPILATRAWLRVLPALRNPSRHYSIVVVVVFIFRPVEPKARLPKGQQHVWPI